MASTSDLRLPLEQACTHTRARAHTRTHTVRADQERSLPKHVCALHCTHDRQRASLAATGYNLLPLTYYSLGVERLFARQLQPPKVCGPQALLHAAARPEHRTVGSHVSTPAGLAPTARCRRAALGRRGRGASQGLPCATLERVLQFAC